MQFLYKESHEASHKIFSHFLYECKLPSVIFNCIHLYEQEFYLFSSSSKFHSLPQLPFSISINCIVMTVPQKNSTVIFNGLLHGFDFRLVILNWLSIKARVFSLPCYLTHRWREERRIDRVMLFTSRTFLQSEQKLSRQEFKLVKFPFLSF